MDWFTFLATELQLNTYFLMPPTTNLQQGQSGPEVKQLQNFLIGQGMTIPSGPTGYFGNETKAALTQWQQRVGVQAPAADLGSNWGPKSIEKAKLVNSNKVPVTQTPSSSAPRTVSTTPAPTDTRARTLTGIPGLAGGPPLSGGQIQQPVPQPSPTYQQSAPQYQPPVPPQPQPVPQPSLNTSSSAVYDALIAADPLLADFFKDGKIKAEFDNLPPELQGTYLQMAQSATRAIEAGKVINPALVNVSPAQLSEFYKQAETEMDPYYKEQFGQLKGDLERSVGRLVEDYSKSIGRSEEPFKQSLATQAQAESEQGTVYSSERNRREASTLLGQNQALGDLAQGVQRSATDLGIGFEQTAGSDLARSLNMPSIQNFSASTQGYTPSATRSLYIPLGGVTGSGQAERTTVLKTRQSELESAYRKNRVLDTSLL